MRRLDCPECPAGRLALEWYSGARRRRERTCPECGASMEIVVPAFPYYSTIIGLSLAGSLVFPICMMMWFMGRIAWATAIIVLFFAILVVSDLFLTRIAVVHSLVNQGEKAARAAGRWYPE